MKPVEPSFRASKPKVQALTLTLLVFALQILFEVPWFLALRSEAYLASQMIVGAVVVRWLLQRRLSIFEFVGLGFAIGSLLALCIDQMLVATPLYTVSWLIIPISASTAVLGPWRKHLEVHYTAITQLPILCVAFLAIVILVQERYWPLYIALSLIPILLFNAFKPPSLSPRSAYTIRLALLTPMAAGTVYALHNRPSMWWIKTQDFQFFEALSYSLTHWGSNDQVFVQGQTVLYHWFSYGWMGLVAKATNAPTWLIQTKVAPIFVAIVLIYLTTALLHRIGIRGWKVVIVLCTFTLLNDFNFESFSMVFSYIWLLAFVYFLLEWTSNQQWRFAFASSFMAAGALGAKSSNIAVIVAGTGMLLLLQLVQKRIRPTLVFAHGAMIAFGLGVVYLKLYFNSPYDATIKFGTIGIAQDIFGDVDSLPRPQFIFWSAVIFVNLILMYFVTIVLVKTDQKKRESFSQFILGAFLSAALTLIVTVSYFEQEEYFLHSFVLFGSLLVGLAISELITQIVASKDRKPYWTSIAIMFAVVGVARFAFSDDNSGEFWAIRSRIANGSSVIALLVAIMIIGVLFRKTLTMHKLALLFVAVAALVTATTLNTKWATNHKSFRAEFNSAGFSEFMIGPTEIQKFLTDARGFIPENAIVASNYECDDPNCSRDSLGADREDWNVGGEAMLMTIYLERRMYISGYGFLWQNVELPEFAKSRLRASSDVTSNTNKASLEELRRANVSFFILDKSMVDQSSDIYLGNVLLESKRFALLDITTSQ